MDVCMYCVFKYVYVSAGAVTQLALEFIGGKKQKKVDVCMFKLQGFDQRLWIRDEPAGG